MFNLKKHSVPSTVASPSTSMTFELPVVNDPGLEAKLRSEVRNCPTCSYTIVNPMNDRCPRCFTVVPLSEHTNCGDCSHQGNCEYPGQGV